MHKLKRLEWYVKFFDERTKVFHQLYDYVHLDEKWFYLTKERGRYFVANDEFLACGKVRTNERRRKLGVLVATARPRFD